MADALLSGTYTYQNILQFKSKYTFFPIKQLEMTLYINYNVSFVCLHCFKKLLNWMEHLELIIDNLITWLKWTVYVLKCVVCIFTAEPHSCSIKQINVKMMHGILLLFIINCPWNAKWGSYGSKVIVTVIFSCKAARKQWKAHDWIKSNWLAFLSYVQ